jgi:RpiB/LacA/LacB family sugar-phosphate isomerase
MKLALGADHAGFELKEEIGRFLKRHGHEPLDMGTHSTESVDYPDPAAAVGEAVRSGMAERGILVCGSGVGTCIAANKLRGVRASVCHDTYSAHQGVEHDAMNVLCLGSRVIGVEVARELVLAFVHAEFAAEERQVRRLDKVNRIEEEEAGKS